MKKIVLKIYDKKNDRVFFKEFQTEFERDKYIRRSKYFKNLIVMKNNIDEYFLKWMEVIYMKIIRSINIEESVWKKLQELAKKENRSASNFIEYLIKMWEKNK